MTIINEIPRSMRKDAVRPGGRKRYRVNCKSTMTSIPGMSTPLKFGIHNVVIHEDDVPQLMAKLEPMPQAWAAAEAIVARELAKYVSVAIPVDIAEVLAIAPEEWPESWTKAAEGFTETNTGAEFRHATGHDHLALTEVTFIEDLPGEMSHEMRITKQVIQGVGGSSDDLKAELDATKAELAGLKATVAELTEAHTAPKGNGKRGSTPK